MILKNSEIIQAIDALNELKDKEMPVELAYKVIEMNETLMEKYTIYLKTLETLKTDKEKMELFNLKTEIIVTPFFMSEFKDAEIKLTPMQAFGLKAVTDG